MGEMPWIDARERCVADGTHLAIPDEGYEALALATRAGGVSSWVGLNDVTTEGDWITVLGGAATFLPWAMGQPDADGDCARLGPSAEIYDGDCPDLYAFVCECER